MLGMTLIRCVAEGLNQTHHPAWNMGDAVTRNSLSYKKVSPIFLFRPFSKIRIRVDNWIFPRAFSILEM